MAGHSVVKHSSRTLVTAILGRPFGKEVRRNLNNPDIQAEERKRLAHLREAAQVFGEQDLVPRFNGINGEMSL